MINDTELKRHIEVSLKLMCVLPQCVTVYEVRTNISGISVHELAFCRYPSRNI